MINNRTIIQRNLLFPNINKNNFEDLISYLGNEMYNKGYVKKTYTKAVIERENNFPTGLNIGSYGIAIPHTDSRHVNDSILGIATTKDFLPIQSMINPQEKIMVKLFFVMAVKEPNRQVDLLKKLMSIFQNKRLLQELEEVKTSNEMYEILSKTGL